MHNGPVLELSVGGIFSWLFFKVLVSALRPHIIGILFYLNTSLLTLIKLLQHEIFAPVNGPFAQLFIYFKERGYSILLVTFYLSITLHLIFIFWSYYELQAAFTVLFGIHCTTSRKLFILFDDLFYSFCRSFLRDFGIYLILSIMAEVIYLTLPF
jgi:hypothetical protein